MAQPNTDPGADKSTTDVAKTDTNTTDKVDVKEPGKDSAKGAEDTSGLKKALAAERKEKEALAKQIRDGELAKLPELERAQSVAKELTDVNEKLTKENLQLKVGIKQGLPWSLAKRLTGDSEEELNADAAELLKHYKFDDKTLVKDDPDNKKKTPTNDTGKRGSSTKPDMNTILRAMKNG